MPSFSQSRVAAYLQNIVSQRREEVGLYHEIAEKLPLFKTHRLLDVGTGSGLQLKVIHEISPSIDLYGIDVSDASIRVARTNLAGMNVDLQVGSIDHTNYPNLFFDIVTCHSSMSYWQDPLSCFNEIFRILKFAGSAHLFEPQKDIDLDEVVETIKRNLADKSKWRKFLASNLNRIGLRWGRKFGLRLYSIDELEEVARQSVFRDSISIEPITLQNLPIFVHIKLFKPERLPSE
jgi:ubiquinone/menaquinone biosynthesis C-methylase UbiE